MKRTINVYLGEAPRHVGILRYNHEGARESASFEYVTGWLLDPRCFAIDPLLPLQAGAQYRKRSEGGFVFHSSIADTEPDGWGKTVIRRDHSGWPAGCGDRGFTRFVQLSSTVRRAALIQLVKEKGPAEFGPLCYHQFWHPAHFLALRCGRRLPIRSRNCSRAG